MEDESECRCSLMSSRFLSNAGYRTIRNSAVPSSIAFEDDSLYGFVVEYDTIYSLHEGWRKAEQVFLTLHAPRASARRSKGLELLLGSYYFGCRF